MKRCTFAQRFQLQFYTLLQIDTLDYMCLINADFNASEIRKIKLNSCVNVCKIVNDRCFVADKCYVIYDWALSYTNFS